VPNIRIKNNKIKESELRDIIRSVISDMIQEIELSEKKTKTKKKQCRKGNKHFDSLGRFSTPSNAKSTSIRVKGKDCETGQRRANPSRWTKVICGRAKADDPNVKAKYRCKDGKVVSEELEPVNCKLKSKDKDIKLGKGTKPTKIELDKKYECDAETKIPYDPKKEQQLKKLRDYESNFDGPYVKVNTNVFDQFMNFIDSKYDDSNNEEPREDIEESNDDKKISKDDYRDDLFAGWREFLRLSRGIV
jgi:hypothetical protein